MEVPLISIAYISIGLICLLKRKWLIKFAIIVLPLTTIALVNVYVEPVFSINLSQYGIILMFVFLVLQKAIKKRDYVPLPRSQIILMSSFILFIPISWIALKNPDLYTLLYVSGIYYPTQIHFSPQHISKALYAIFGFFVFIVTYETLSFSNFRVIAKAFILSGFLMALLGLFDFIFPEQMEWLRKILIPPNVSMGGSLGYEPIVGWGGVQRVYGLMWEAGGLAEYLLGITFFMLANLVLNNVLLGKLKDRLILLTLAITTIFTGSTSILVAIFLFPIMVLFTSLSIRKTVVSIWFRGAGIALLLLLIIWGFSFVYPDNIGYFYEWTLYKLRLAGEIGGGAREGGSLELLKIFPQSPVIGLGLGSVGFESSVFGAGLIMLLVNVGIIGTLLYILVMISIIKESLKKSRYDDSKNYPFRIGFLWAFILLLTIELLGRGLAILHTPHLWFLAGVCIAVAQKPQDVTHKMMS